MRAKVAKKSSKKATRKVTRRAAKKTSKKKTSTAPPAPVKIGKAMDHEVRIVPIDKVIVIEEDNMRQEVGYGDIPALAATIKRDGQDTPVSVTDPDTEGYYTLITGYRRMRAIRHAELPDVRIQIHVGLDKAGQDMLRLRENTDRKSLSPYEIAITAQRLKDEHGISTAKLCNRLAGESETGKSYSRSYLDKLIGLLDTLAPEPLEAWRNASPATGVVALEAMARMPKAEQTQNWLARTGNPNPNNPTPTGAGDPPPPPATKRPTKVALKNAADSAKRNGMTDVARALAWAFNGGGKALKLGGIVLVTDKGRAPKAD
jgi:ParB/RepB/Spo0J family partition protein